jgi:hypothetical protein
MNQDIANTLHSIRSKKTKKRYRSLILPTLIIIAILVNCITFWALCKENQINHMETTYQLELLKLQLN